MPVMQALVHKPFSRLMPLTTILLTRETFKPLPKPIACPQRRKKLAWAIAQCKLLGSTQDGKEMYLYEFQGKTPLLSPILKEIGCLREIAFRVDGLVMADMQFIKEKKRQRYMGK